MSAQQDKTQKIAFVYDNLYRIYRKGTEQAKAAPEVKASEKLALNPQPLTTEPFVIRRESAIVKANQPNVKVEEYRPMEFLKRAPATSSHASIDGLKANLKSLNELHGKLRFLLQELETMVSNKK